MMSLRCKRDRSEILKIKVFFANQVLQYVL